MQTNYKKKLAGTSIFALLLVGSIFATVAFAQAAASQQGQTSGNGKKIGHVYGIGNSGAPPPGQGGVPPGQAKNN